MSWLKGAGKNTSKQQDIRMKAALESCKTNIMIADESHKAWFA